MTNFLPQWRRFILPWLRWSVLIKHSLLSLMGHLAHLKSLMWAINEFYLVESLKLLLCITLEQLSTTLSVLGNAGNMPLNQCGFTWCLHRADGATGWWKLNWGPTACFGKIFSCTRQSTFFHHLFLGSFGVWVTIFAHHSMSFWKHFMVSLGHIFILIVQVLRLK